MSEQKAVPEIREDRCWYCDQGGTDHNHGSGRSCGDCCAIHGSLCQEETMDEYNWVKDCLRAKNERIAALTAENTRLREQIGGFPNLDAMRQAMIDTADENTRLREQVEALSKPVSEWISVKEALPENGQVVIVAGGVAYRMRGEWNTLTGEAWPGKPIQWEVTHWMPLPTPPASEKEGRDGKGV